MRYMLDTNICSYILKRHPLSVKAHFDQVGPEALCISAVVLAELYLKIGTATDFIYLEWFLF
jgi:tRNA(fMet)-specific endonuclease VapC